MSGRSFSALFVLVVLIGVIYTQDVPIAADLKHTPCAPGDFFQIDCNTCYCNMERSGYLCASNSCPENKSSSTTEPTVSEKSVVIINDHEMENNNANDNNLDRFPKILEHPSHIHEKSTSQASATSSSVINKTPVLPIAN